MSRVAEDAHAAEGTAPRIVEGALRSRVAEDATRKCAVAEDCLFTPH